MTVVLVLLRLAGAVTLLLWAVRMVRTGVERSYGASLDRALKGARGGRLKLAVVGAFAAVVLQSATAVAILGASIAAGGLLTASQAMALLLGADFGSALVVQVLSLDLSWLMPLLLISGGWLFLKGRQRRVRQTGRILMGIGLVLVSLELLGDATAPLRHSTALPAVVGYLRGDMITSFLIGAVFAWLVHSSVASVLLVASMATQHVLPVELGIPLVLGANLGGALVPVVLTRAAVPAARRVPLGNLACRGVGAMVALAVLQVVTVPLDLFGADPAQQIVLLHLAFNLMVAVVFVPFAGMIEPLLHRVLPDAGVLSEPGNLLANRVSLLDRSVVHTPRLALASATRELLRTSELIEVMLRPVMELFETGNRERVRELRRLDQEINRAHSELKLYLVELNRGVMDADEARRSMELANFSINLDHVGDLTARNLLKLVEGMRAKQLSFSSEGWRELTEQHAKVMANLQLALNVLISGDRESARDLVAEKERMRDLELRSQDRHLRRLQDGTIKSIETSEIHLETIRVLKQINSLLASVAYPILSEAGELLRSRLAEADYERSDD